MPRRRLVTFLSAATIVALASLASADTQLEPAPTSVVLSDGSGEQSPDLEDANKVKLARLGNGQLVAVFGDAAGDEVFDVKSRSVRLARDIYARRCNSKQDDCSDMANWSPAINLSQSAGLSSIATAWQGEGSDPLPYPGDSDKPNIFKVGGELIVSWVDKYCPGGAQGTVRYPELQGREIPYSCTWVTRSTNGGMSWSPAQRLSDGSRDAKGDVPRGSTPGWAVVWQEDPAGLQLGEGDGPGDGASGARASGGTDIWYTWLSAQDFSAGAGFPKAVRLTDNFTKVAQKQGVPLGVEDGQFAASRPNLALFGPTAVLAYEESKSTGGVDEGKYVRYHHFPFNQPPDSCADDPNNPGSCKIGPAGDAYPAQDDPARMGCIISDPQENGRRVRFFGQGTPGGSGTKLYIIWKQGDYIEGGPSDIVGRAGVIEMGQMGADAGFRPADMVPPIAAPTATQLGDTPDGCLIPGDPDLLTGAQANAPGTNLSAETPAGGELEAGTSDNNLEDARAHRGTIKGDTILVGYSYTPDWAVARYTNLENYDFWVRVSQDGGATWTAPTDVSSPALDELADQLGVIPTAVNVSEPRIVKTPGAGPGCPSGDPMDMGTTDPSDCPAGSTYVVAFGTETNVYEQQGSPESLDIFITRTTDKGQSYEAVVPLAAGPTGERETQIQVTPDGSQVYAAYDELIEGGGSNSVLKALEPVEGPGDGDGDTGTDTGTADTTGDTDTAGDTDTGDTTGTTGDGDTGTTGGGEDEVGDDTDTGDTRGDTAAIDDGGCTCTSAGPGPSGSGWLGALALLALVAPLRRRSSD